MTMRPVNTVIPEAPISRDRIVLDDDEVEIISVQPGAPVVVNAIVEEWPRPVPPALPVRPARPARGARPVPPPSRPAPPRGPRWWVLGTALGVLVLGAFASMPDHGSTALAEEREQTASEVPGVVEHPEEAWGTECLPEQAVCVGPASDAESAVTADDYPER